METCTVILIVAGIVCAILGFWVIRLDTQNEDLQGWVDRTQKELSYLQRRHPGIMRDMAKALSTRYLDEGDPDHV